MVTDLFGLRMGQNTLEGTEKMLYAGESVEFDVKLGNGERF